MDRVIDRMVIAAALVVLAGSGVAQSADTDQSLIWEAGSATAAAPAPAISIGGDCAPADVNCPSGAGADSMLGDSRSGSSGASAADTSSPSGPLPVDDGSAARQW